MKKWLGIMMCTVILVSGGCSSNSQEQKNPSGDEMKIVQGVNEKAEQGGKSEEYTIALIAPFTGDAAQYGEAFKTGVTVACNEVNAAGGINGINLNLEVFDDAADAAQSTNMAQIVTSDEEYIAAIGTYSSTQVLAMASIFDEAQMPLMVPCAGNSMISTDYNYTFQRGMTIPIEASMMARYAVQKLGGQRIAFIALNNDAGLQFIDSVENQMKEMKDAGTDCEIVAIEKFNEGEVRDYSAMVLKIKEADPDVVVVNIGYVECAAILNQARQAGLECQWLGNQSMYTEDFTKLVGDTAIGFDVSTAFFAENPDEKIQEFVNECKEIDGKIPNAYARNAYECTAMIAQCLKDGATTRQELYDALCNMEIWEGKTGTNQWKNRQSVEDYLILQYKGNDKWELFDSEYE